MRLTLQSQRASLTGRAHCIRHRGRAVSEPPRADVAAALLRFALLSMLLDKVLGAETGKRGCHSQTSGVMVRFIQNSKA